MATLYGHNEIVKILIASGADVNSMDNKGLTPIDLVHNEEIKEILIEAGGR